MLFVWLLYVLMLVAQLVGLVLTLVTLPGLWLMVFVDIVYAALTRLHYLGPRMLITLFLLALLAEVIDLAMGSLVAKRVGGGRPAVLGAFVGGIVGAFFFPLGPLVIVGILAGSFIGAFALQLVFSGDAVSSVQVGLGAAGGKALGIVSKVVFGVVMLLLVIVRGWP